MKPGVLLVVAVVIALLAGNVQAAEPASPKDFVAISKQTSGRQDGRTFTFEEKLYVNGRLAGRDRVRCEYREKVRCFARFRLDGGTILGDGVLTGRDRLSSLPLVDGTGRYEDVRGTLIAEELGKKKSKLTFDFRN